jgi:hypothetical protein
VGSKLDTWDRVEGGPQAEEGRLVVMAAGDATLYDELQPVLALLARQTFFLGECGQGTHNESVFSLSLSYSHTHTHTHTNTHSLSVY